MYLDVLYLMAFYEQPLGRIIRPIVNAEIGRFWPTLSHRRLMGFGFATPYLQPFKGKTERSLACMPAVQGVTNWPRNDLNLTCLVDEYELPFEDGSLDNVLIIHGIEMTRHPEYMLREIWRVLAPAGRVLIITTNRSGLWARTESSPFGYGHPYSRGQLNSLVESCDFQAVNMRTALHVPPSKRRIVLQSASVLETLGRRFWPRLGGLIMLEAQKIENQQAPVKVKGRRAVRLFRPALATGQTVAVCGTKEKLPVRQKDSSTTMAW